MKKKSINFALFLCGSIISYAQQNEKQFLFCRYQCIPLGPAMANCFRPIRMTKSGGWMVDMTAKHRGMEKISEPIRL